MKNYEDLLLERVQILTGKLAQKQREGSLTEELSLCVRLAQLHSQLSALNVSLQFWQSCFQIAADLADEEEEWRAAAEISKIYCKSGQIENSESFMKENLCSKRTQTPLRLSLLQAEVIETMGKYFSRDHGKFFYSASEFLAYERALKVLDEAFGLANSQNIWWWEAVTFRAELLMKLGRFEDSRYSEAIDTLQTVQSNGNVLISLRTKSTSAQIYFEMGEFQTALDFAISVIDEYKADPQNSTYRPRRRIYCEMLFLAGRALKNQKDFNFSLENLLLAKDEAQSLTAECEFMKAINRATQETLAAKEASIEANQMSRKRELLSPRDLEELAGLFGVIGDFNRQCELLEQCRDVATSETSKRRLDKKLLDLYSSNLNKWREIERKFPVDDFLFQDWKNLIIKAKAFENVGKFDDAEGCLLKALKDAHGDREGEMICNSALFFLNRQRGRISIAAKFGEEAQSLETIFRTKSSRNSISIDPNFSYFVTRKPSNSLLKMMGSGMVMRTKTKKTSGLQLKRRRDTSKLGFSMRRRKEVSENCDNSNGKDYTDDDGYLSDFIVSGDEEEEEVKSDSVSETKILTAKSQRSLKMALLVLSSDEDEPHTQPQIQHYHCDTGIAQDSPLMIRTASLSDPFSLPGLSPIKIDFSEKPTQPSKSKSKSQSSTISKVVVRIRKGIEVLVPVDAKCTVAELIRSAQTRFEKLFPSDVNRFGRINGLSVSSPSSNSLSAMLFPDDYVSSILSSDLEILQAHFSDNNTNNNNENNFCDSPSKFNSIEEEFKRKFQILNLKKDCQDEILWLKELQERFSHAKSGQLDFSTLSMDSARLSDNYLLTSKLVKMAAAGNLNLRENLLVDDDLKVFDVKDVLNLDLSLNFLRKPTGLKSIHPESADLSYNPIDCDWLISNATTISKSSLNLIGCFDKADCNWNGLGKALRSIKKIEISLPSHSESQISFLTGLCEPCDSVNLEELSLFAVEFINSEEALVELSYIESLKRLKFNCCSFKNEAIAAICKILKRSTALERLEFKENDVESGENDPIILQSFGIVET